MKIEIERKDIKDEMEAIEYDYSLIIIKKKDIVVR